MHCQEYILGCELNPFKLTVYMSLLIMGHSYSGEVLVTQKSSLGFLKPYRHICFEHLFKCYRTFVLPLD